jgi:hypothetical protein
MKKIFFFVHAAMLMQLGVSAQNPNINTDGSKGDPNARIRGTKKGLFMH